MAAEPVDRLQGARLPLPGGGNDANNWIVPTDTTTYADYTAIRGNLALPQASLLPLRTRPAHPRLTRMPTGTPTASTRRCPELQTLFGEDKLAAVLNVGTLVRPTTRAQYICQPDRLPPAAALLAQRSGHPVADLDPRPAADHRLGRARRRPAECRRPIRAATSRCPSRSMAPTPSRSAISSRSITSPPPVR